MTSQSTETRPTDSTESTGRRFTNSVTIRLGDHPEIPQPMPGLLEGRVTLIAGTGGGGKTTLTEQIVRHLCSGHQLGRFPLPDEPLAAWCMFLEDDESMTQDRSLRVAARGVLEEDRIGTSRVEYVYGRGWSMAAFAAELQLADEEKRLPGLIIIDHLRILIGPQPAGSSPNDWERKCLLNLVGLAGRYGVHLVVLTHLNKAGTVSGTTELVNCVDTAYVIEPKDDRNYATLKCYKMRLAPETDYALSRKANGTWGFDDEIFVSETLAQGIARDILAVLRTEGPQTLSQLCTHPAVSGARRGVQQALTRAKKQGWVKSSHGHWEIVLTDGDMALRAAPGDCSVCGLAMERLYEGQSSHPGCDVERSMPTIVTPRTPEPEPEPQPEPADEPEPELELEEDSATGFQGIKVLKESIAKSRMHPLPCVPKAERDSEPWSLWTEASGGAPNTRVFERTDVPAGGQIIVVDRNGSYLSACSSVPVAPNKLIHTGPLEKYDRAQAGMYQIELPEWTETTMPHPLGRLSTRRESLVWVTTPHMRLLVKLAAADRIGPIIIRDSWTGNPNESLFEPFYRKCRDTRDVLYGTGAPYTDYKISASSALRLLWPKTVRSPFWRPDWRLSIVAEANVRHWVAADNAVAQGAFLVSLGNTDEATFWTPDGELPAPYIRGNKFGAVGIKGADK